MKGSTNGKERERERKREKEYDSSPVMHWRRKKKKQNLSTAHDGAIGGFETCGRYMYVQYWVDWYI